MVSSLKVATLRLKWLMSPSYGSSRLTKASYSPVAAAVNCLSTVKVEWLNEDMWPPTACLLLAYMLSFKPNTIRRTGQPLQETLSRGMEKELVSLFLQIEGGSEVENRLIKS